LSSEGYKLWEDGASAPNKQVCATRRPV